MSTFTDIEYPYFKKGQVLKNTDLNNMVEYLDEQNRTTRVLVVGSGIFSGLEVDVSYGTEENAPVYINVNQGFGVSSDGYIIQLHDNDPGKKITYSHYKKLIVSESHFRCKEANETDEIEDSWETFELLQEYAGIEGEDAVKPLIEIANEEDVDGSYCLILWVSQEQKDRPYCIDICDDNGADLNISIKALLVKLTDLQSIEEEQDEADVESAFNPPVVNIHPFGYAQTEIMVPGSDNSIAAKVVNPALIHNYDDFLNNYRKIIEEAIAPSSGIVNAYNWAYSHMNLLGLGGGTNPFTGLSNGIKNILELYSNPVLVPNTPPENIDIQYLFLYLHDLKKAFEEFVHAVCKVKTSILPDLCTHVRYIALNGIAVNSLNHPFLSVTQGCRTTFQPSLFNGVNSTLIKEVVFLYERMKKLTTFNVNDQTSMPELPVVYKTFPFVRVIPGRERQSLLSKHSIPYYLNKDIKNFWSVSSAIDCQDPKVTGYRYLDNQNFFPTDNPLLYQDDEYNFFRIEGHVGKNTQIAYDTLKLWIDHFNLPIALKIVYLDLFDIGRQEFGSVEMKVMEEKYVEIRNNFVTWLNGRECPVPPDSLLPLQLSDFNCNDLRQWFNNDNNCYRPYEAECYINAMLTLSVSYDIEQRLLRDMYRFSEFASAHPGMQHLGGVPKGGTFVLVNSTVIDPEIERFIEGSRKMEKDNRFGNVASVSTAGIRRYVEENSSHIVVGDFALPYICCDGDNLIEPFIILVPNEFCSTDEKKYEIMTYPRGGIVTGSSTQSNREVKGLPPYVTYDGTLQKFYFHPNLVVFEGASTSLELAYKISGLSAKAQVVIYQKAQQVTFKPLENVPEYDAKGLLWAQKIKLAADSNGGFQSSWLIDGVRVADNATNVLETTLYYHNKTQYLITFDENNGICKTETNYELALCSLIQDVSLDFEGTPQFSEDPKEDESVAILASPNGGRFKMKNADGLFFDPNIKTTTIVDESGNQRTEYRLINSAENPLPAGRFFLTYELPVCGKASDPHDFYVQNDPVIVLKRYSFCSNDKHRYPVYLHPADATLVAEPSEGLINDEGQYFFEPSGITKFENNVATVILTCDPPGDGAVVTRELTIFKVPDEIIEIESNLVFDEEASCKLVGFQYKFRAGDGLANRYEWQLNDETKAVYHSDVNGKVNDFEIVIPLSNNPDVVKLIVEIEIAPGDTGKLSKQALTCSNVIVKDMERRCPDSEKLKIIVSQQEDKPNIFNVEVNPVGGSYVLVDENGKTVLDNLPLRRNGEESCQDIKGFFFDASELNETNDIGPGRYRIRYSFAECNISVDSEGFEIKFSEEVPSENLEVPEVRDTDDTNVVTPDSLAERRDVAGFINSRLSERQSVMDELATDSGLTQTKTYGLAKMFILFSGAEQELNERYQQALSLGLSSLKRASGDRKIQYTQIIENITLAYLDKLVISSHDGLSEETKSILNDVSENLKPTEIKINKIIKNWEGDKLKKVMKASSVDEIKKTMK